jgi:hypothetical protein
MEQVLGVSDELSSPTSPRGDRPSAVAIVRKLARSLIYSVLDELLLQKVVVHSAETAPEDILAGLAGRIPPGTLFIGPELRHRSGTIAKYGLLDLRYQVEIPVSRPQAVHGLTALRELGFLEKASEDEAEDDLLFLKDMLEETGTGHLFLKVFLETEYDIEKAKRLRRLYEGMPSSFWPREFIVGDACITNAASVWINKHFYV